jgi:hypothetical protein
LNQSELENKTIAELRTIAKGLNVKSPFVMITEPCMPILFRQENRWISSQKKIREPFPCLWNCPRVFSPKRDEEPSLVPFCVYFFRKS